MKSSHIRDRAGHPTPHLADLYPGDHRQGGIMATFYLLPSRLTLGKRFGDFLATIFPGLRWDRDTWSDLAEMLAAAADPQPGVFVLFYEDLCDEGDLESCLALDFGAEPGDVIVEIHGAGSVIRRWKMCGTDAKAA